jgi:hypothetical protein
MTRASDGRTPRDLQVPTPTLGPAAARHSSRAERRGTSTRSEERRSTHSRTERAGRCVGAQRSTPPRRSATPRQRLPAGHSSVVVLPQSPRRNQEQRRRSAGARDLRALCNALCNGLHSARPLIPDSGVLFRASWIRPRPPYVPSSLGLPGSDPVLEQHPDRGSAGGRSSRKSETEDRTDRGERQNKCTAAPAPREEREGRGGPCACRAWRLLRLP